MRKIKVVVLLVQQLQHGFTKNAKVSPNLTVALIGPTSEIKNFRQRLQSGELRVSYDYLRLAHSDFVSYVCGRVE